VDYLHVCVFGKSEQENINITERAGEQKLHYIETESFNCEVVS